MLRLMSVSVLLFEEHVDMNRVFSVIILHYNQPEYWKSAVDSVLCQTYPEIQLIFSDDGSCNFQIDDVKEYIDKKKNGNIIDVKVIHHENTVGIVKNLNGAYKYCIGKYVLQFAADDALYDSDVLMHFSLALDNTSDGIFGVFARSLDCDENLVWRGTEYVEPDRAKAFSLLAPDEQYRKFICRCDIHMGATSFLMENLKKVLPLDLEYRLLDDWPLMLRVTRNGKKFCFADFKALLYRAGGVSRPIKEREFALTRYICQDHLRVFDKEILPYTKMITFKELWNVMKRYDYDRKWMKRAAGEFESKKRIEVLCSDWRVIFTLVKKIISFQGILTCVLSASLLNCFLMFDYELNFDKNIFGVLNLFFLVICNIIILFQNLLLIKRYLFNTF